MWSNLSEMLLTSTGRHGTRKCVGRETYNQVFRLSQEYGTILRSHGVQRHDRVCWHAPKSSHWIAAMIATWQNGGVFVPLTTGNMTLNQHIIHSVKPKIVLTSDCRHSHTRLMGENHNNHIGQDDPALILFTSGSTNAPKGVVLSHRNILSNLSQIQERIGGDITKTDSSYSILPWHHCYGLVCELLYLVMRGASIHVPSAADPKKIMRDMKWASPTLFFAVPKVIESLYRHDIKYAPRFVKRNFVFGKNIRRMSVGGAQCLPELIHFMDEEYRVPVLQGYGMTETSPMISMNAIDNLNKIGTAGKLLCGIDIKFVGEDHEISVRGDNIMMGYLKEVDEFGSMHLIRHKGWWNTGDSGHVDPDGFLCISGRTKTHYKLSNGKYVNPTYIESIICMSPIIEQAVVFGDGLRCNHVIVYSKEKDKDLLLQNIRESLAEKVQPYEIPRCIILADEPFTLLNGLLTQKLEPNRRRILELYVK